jgi:hypothetical protein
MLPKGLDGKHRTAATPVQGSKWDLGMSSERIRGADAQYPLGRKPKLAVAVSEANRVTLSFRSPL